MHPCAVSSSVHPSVCTVLEAGGLLTSIHSYADERRSKTSAHPAVQAEGCIGVATNTCWERKAQGCGFNPHFYVASRERGWFKALSLGSHKQGVTQ